MPPHMDPYGGMGGPPGPQFDMRPIDDGVPTHNVKSGGFRAALVFIVIAAIGGGVLGAGFGMSTSGRRAYNDTNKAAKRVKAEVEEMHKTVKQIATAVALSQQRLRAAKMDRLAYDPQLISELEKIKLEPRPGTSQIFRVDYSRMPDLAVDNLMTYYYDTISLYSEVERHVKKSQADKASLEAGAKKEVNSLGTNFGVVFGSAGKIMLSNLVELGDMVCKGGGTECNMADLSGFKVRGKDGASWVERPVSSNLQGNMVAPLDRTELLQTVMTGSPEQARLEQYRLRMGEIHALLTRIAATEKQLSEAVDKAAQRPDMFTF